MKNLKIFSLVFFFFAFATVCDADDPLITTPIKVHVESPGNLENQIGETKAKLITNLTLTGDLNGRDIQYLRYMAGLTNKGYRSGGNLQYLDLSDANIVYGSDKYYINDIDGYNTYYNEIGKYMFYKCTFVSIKLPKTSKIIDESAFAYCNNLKEVVIPDGITVFGSGCFYECVSLDKITLPQNLESIGDGAFCRCIRLRNIDIPKTVKEIGLYAFKGCTGLTSVNITDFNAWCDIMFYTLESNPVYYAKHLYVNGEEIDNINIPFDITFIRSCVYCGMESLKKANIHSNVTDVGSYTFYGCKNMSEIYVHAIKPPEVGTSCFEGINKRSCTLYVPRGTYMDYFLAEGWGDFLNIVEFDATGIDNPDLSCDPKPVDYYNINGMKTTRLTKGLNILRMSDGTYMKTSF